jgi:hypothetical protein
MVDNPDDIWMRILEDNESRVDFVLDFRRLLKSDDFSSKELLSINTIAKYELTFAEGRDICEISKPLCVILPDILFQNHQPRALSHTRFFFKVPR